jgi:hypothetical protein
MPELSWFFAGSRRDNQETACEIKCEKIRVSDNREKKATAKEIITRCVHCTRSSWAAAGLLRRSIIFLPLQVRELSLVAEMLSTLR